jgi:hypothetical protein
MTLYVLGLLACSEYTVREALPTKPADPPGREDDGVGDAPDWADCGEGLEGHYYNLPWDHPDVEPDLEADPEDSWQNHDWWGDNYATFDRYDTSIDHGPSWWPVDDGLLQDPAYFAVRWVAWLRVRDDDEAATFVFGASDDLWIDIDGVTMFRQAGLHDYEPISWSIELDPGQYPLEIRYAHRGGRGGFSFRAVGEDLTLCHPEHTP